MENGILINIVWVSSILTYLASCIITDRKKSLQVIAVGDISYALYFILNGLIISGLTSLASFVVTTLAIILINKDSDKLLNWVYWSLVGSIVITSAFYMKTPYELIVIFCMILSGLAKRQPILRMKYMFFASNTLTIIFGLLVNLSLPVVLGIVLDIALIYSIYKIKKDEK